MKEKLKIVNLSKTFHQGEFNEVKALKHCNLEFRSGENVLIIGDNGSGKSTLLNTIDGRIKQTTGEILIDSIPIHNFPTYKRAEKYIFRLFQESVNGIFPLGSIRENMAVANNRNKKISWFKPLVKKADDDFFKQIIRDFRPELAENLDKKVFTLSPGERQALVLALLQLQTNSEPQILLADEPTASLDPFLSEKCFNTIKKYSERGWLCLQITHNVNTIMKHKGRIIKLEKGKIIYDKII